MEKSSKTKQDKKSFISTSACFLTAIAKVQFLERRLGIYTQIWDFLNIFLFPKILSLMSFGNLRSNSYTKFAILDITFPSPCGWLDSGLKHCKVSKYYDQDLWFDTKRKLSLSLSKTLTHKTPYFPYN